MCRALLSPYGPRPVETDLGADNAECGFNAADTLKRMPSEGARSGPSGLENNHRAYLRGLTP